MSGRAAEIYRFDRLVGMRLLVSKRLRSHRSGL